MCIRDSIANVLRIEIRKTFERELPTPSEAPADELLGPLLTQACASLKACLLYTSDAADERSSVDLGGRRIIKKKKRGHNSCQLHTNK